MPELRFLGEEPSWVKEQNAVMQQMIGMIKEVEDSVADIQAEVAHVKLQVEVAQSIAQDAKWRKSETRLSS